MKYLKKYNEDKFEWSSHSLKDEINDYLSYLEDDLDLEYSLEDNKKEFGIDKQTYSYKIIICHKEQSESFILNDDLKSILDRLFKFCIDNNLNINMENVLAYETVSIGKIRNYDKSLLWITYQLAHSKNSGSYNKSGQAICRVSSNYNSIKEAPEENIGYSVIDIY